MEVDEEYLATLQPNTMLMLLQPSEEWCPTGEWCPPGSSGDKLWYHVYTLCLFCGSNTFVTTQYVGSWIGRTFRCNWKYSSLLNICNYTSILIWRVQSLLENIPVTATSIRLPAIHWLNARYRVGVKFDIHHYFYLAFSGPNIQSEEGMVQWPQN